MYVRDRDVHKQWYQTEFFFSFSFTLSEPLMLRIHQKFKAQAFAGTHNTLAGVCSHTHDTDKIDRFIYIIK